MNLDKKSINFIKVMANDLTRVYGTVFPISNAFDQYGNCLYSAELYNPDNPFVDIIKLEGKIVRLDAHIYVVQSVDWHSGGGTYGLTLEMIGEA